MKKKDNDGDFDGEELSEYELLRLNNIKERQKLLSTLGIDTAVSELKALSPSVAKRKASSSARPAKRIKVEKEVTPLREPSRRLRNLAAKELQSIKTEVKEELVEEEKDERLLGSMPMAIEDEESKDLLKRLAEIKNDIAVDPDVDLRTCDLKEFQMTISSLHLVGEEKMLTKRIQSLEVHPVKGKKLIMAGSTNGYIGLWDLDLGQVASFHPHCAPVNCLSVSTFDHSKIYSTSHDGTLICGDLEMKLFTNVFATDYTDRLTHLTWHDQLDQHRLLVTHGNGSVGVVDTRESEGIRTWIPCYERSARTVQHHPADDNYFLVSSGAGCSCSIFDIRKCSSKKAEPVSEMHHKKGLTSAFFSPSGDQVLTTCNDDYLRIYTSPLDANPILKSSIAHNNFTGRWLSVFKAKWFPGRDDAFFIGSLLTPRRIQIYGVHGKLINEVKDPDMTTITSLVAVHPSLPFIVGGNSSGKAYAFSSLP